MGLLDLDTHSGFNIHLVLQLFLGPLQKKNKHRASVRFHSLICLKCADIFKLSKYLCLFSFNILMLNNCKQIHFVVQLLNLVQLFATSWTAACQASLSFIVSQSLFKLMFIKLMIPSNRLILCHPVPLLPSIFPSTRVFSNELALCIRWPKYWSFSISLSSEHSGLISFRIDWLDLLAVQGSLKSLLQHHSSEASIIWCSAFFAVQLSHLYMTLGKTIALTRWTFVS